MQLFNPYKTFVGSFIPNCLMKYPHLSSSAKLLWARLAQYAGDEGVCWPKQETMAEELGLSVDRIRQVLKELRDEKFLYVERPSGTDRFNHSPNKYHFILHPIFTDGGYCCRVVENYDSISSEKNQEESKEKIQKESSISKPRRTIFPSDKPTDPLIESFPAHFVESRRLMNKWQEFVNYRKLIKAPIRTSNVGSKLVRLSNGEVGIAIKIMQQSMDNEWRGLFEVTEGNRNGANRPGDKGSAGKYSEIDRLEIDD